MSKPQFTIVFKESEWYKWWEYQACVNTEIACMGYATNDVPGELYVDEIFLVPQIAEAAGVDFVTKGLPYAVEKSIADDRIDDLRFCIHSHVNFGTHWSGTDENMIDAMGQGGKLPWFASVVTNKKGEMLGRVDLWNPVFEGLGQVTLDEDHIRVGKEIDWDKRDATIKEIEGFLLEKPKPKVTKKWTKTTKPETAFRGKDVADTGIQWMKHSDAMEIAKGAGWEGIEYDGFVYWFQEIKGKSTCVAQSMPLDSNVKDFDLDDAEVQEVMGA